MRHPCPECGLPSVQIVAVPNPVIKPETMVNFGLVTYWCTNGHEWYEMGRP